MEELLTNADTEIQWIFNAIAVVLFVGGLIAAAALIRHHRRNPPDHATLTAALAARSWSTPQVGLLLSTLFGLYALAMFSGRLFYEEQLPLAQLAITLFIYAILVVIIAVINRRRGTGIGAGARAFRQLPLAALFYVAVIPFLMIATQAWHWLLQHLFGMEIELQGVAQFIAQERSWLQVAYMFTAVIVAPLYEELMFRGIIFPYLAKRIGLAGGIVLVSVLFALMHFHRPAAVPLFLLSGALCLAYWRTGSLWVAIGMHALFNAVTILALTIIG